MALREYDFDKEPTVSIVKSILTDAIKMKATDVHFDPKPKELSIRFRINGDLVEYTTAPDNYKVNITTRVKILSNMNITESILPQTGSINFDYNNKSHNMRVSSLPVADGEKIAIHLSNYANNLKSISRMGFKEEDVKKIKNLIKDEQGIILVTGTTTSGKTTTLYTLLKEMNSKSKNIISIEDPIKMKIEGINQVQITPEKGLTYKTVLRNVLLQDPNIICINELIDDETARTALRASTTGKLVLSTMHTKNIYSTIDTLLNMDIENYLLGANLNGIISQRLVKKLCPHCKEKKSATEFEKTVIKAITGEEISELNYPKGCEECQNGYSDQIPVIEIINIDEELRSAISNNKNRSLIRKLIYTENDSILKDGFKKVIEGETSFNEIIRITDVKIDFSHDETNIKEYILGNGEKEFKSTEKIKKELDEKQKSEKQPQEIELTNETIENKIEENKEIDVKSDETSPTRVENTKKEQTTEENENNTIVVKSEIEEVKEIKAEIEKVIEEKNENNKEEKIEPVYNLNEDEEDEDDFNYGFSYINNF